MKKTLIILSLMTTSFAMADELVDIEAKKAKIQNAFDSVSLDIAQDALCLDKFTECMDTVCSNSKASRCVCASYFDSFVLPKRMNLISKQEQTLKIIETDIPELKNKKISLTKASAWGGAEDEDFDIESMTYKSTTAGLFLNTKIADFADTGTSLFNKGLKNCEKIAKSCSSMNSSKIVNGYKTRVNLTCNEYMEHLNKQDEIISENNNEALKIKTLWRELTIGGTYNILTCENKIKEFYIRECKGFDYKDCITCSNVNSADNCKKEIKKNFDSKKDRVYLEIGKNCGKTTFDKAYADVLDEVNGNFASNLKFAQKSSDSAMDADIKDYTDKITSCVSEVCGLTWQNCETQSQIDDIMQGACIRHLENLETRFTNTPSVVNEVKAKVRINIEKSSKLRGKNLNAETNSRSLYE